MTEPISGTILESDIQFRALIVLEVLAVASFFGIFQALMFQESLFLIAIGVGFGIACFVLFGRAITQMSPKELGLTTIAYKENIFFGIIFGIILHLAFSVYYFATYEKVLFLLPYRNLAIIPIALLVVFSEELFFRGYMLPRLEGAITSHATFYAVLINSILFCFYHQSLLFSLILYGPYYSTIESMMINFAGSIILSIIFVKFRSLISPTLAHALFDILFYIHFAFPYWLIP
ncbi:MAG: CPBP family intramembrane glutamic endopeptidase [Promethearchaeota archaeon]